jgi:ribosomal protein S27AE
MCNQEPVRVQPPRVQKKEAPMMPRWKLKDCPRCGGDVFMDIDENGWLGHCLQCGYMGKALSNTPQASSGSGLRSEIGSRLAKAMYFAKK